MNTLEHLLPHIPPEAKKQLKLLISGREFEIRLSKPRASKLGDFRPTHKGKTNRISVNKDLNPYAFLITLIHEIAHLICWEQYQNKVDAHGEEWKRIYGNCLRLFLGYSIFPIEVEEELVNHIRKPGASSCSDNALMRILKKYDQEQDTLFLSEIPENSWFSIRGGRVFMKKEKLRKRYRCMEEHSRKVYLIHELAEVNLIPK